MRSLEQKMVAGTNVSSSKTTEWNILIVFYTLQPSLFDEWRKLLIMSQSDSRKLGSAGSYLIVVPSQWAVSVVDNQTKDAAGRNDQG